MNEAQDTGKHYRFHYRKRITQQDIEQGFIDLQVDPFKIAEIYKITNFAQLTAMKKILCTGNRGHKDLERDIDDIICALVRWKELLGEEKLVAANSVNVVAPKVGTINLPYKQDKTISEELQNSVRKLNGGVFPHFEGDMTKVSKEYLEEMAWRNLNESGNGETSYRESDSACKKEDAINMVGSLQGRGTDSRLLDTREDGCE